MNNTGIIILAAGNSSRYGSAKQLLPYKGKSFLVHTIEEAMMAQLHPVIVITGADTTRISAAIKEHPVTSVYNDNWQQGMASGIVCGLSEISAFKNIEQVIIAVCDQPFIAAIFFRKLIQRKTDTGKGIIACTYADTIGTPVLFSQQYFKILAMLKGDEGAKKLLKIYPGDVATIDFPYGHVDIDTMEDYKSLQES